VDKVNTFLGRGHARVEEFIRSGVELWHSEGRLDDAKAEELLLSLNTPEVAQGLFHAGAHFAISLPLRFPLGAAARLLYTLFLRLQGEASGLWHRQRPVSTRRLHTLSVMLFALIPGFGRLAYLFCPALVRQRLLLVIPMDHLSRRLPLGAYERFHLGALFVYWARENPVPGGFRRFSPLRLLDGLGVRLRAMAPQVPLFVTVLAIDAVAFGIGAYLYLQSDRTSKWWFEERSVIATLDVVQLLVAGIAGIAAYQTFWRRRFGTTEEAFGIFLWGIGGVGLLLFAMEDYFTVHESLAPMFISVIPGGTNAPDDIFILGYAFIGVGVLYVFHTELVAERGSTALLAVAAVSAIVMVLTDAFAHALALKAVELPAQTLADTFLMFAFLTRFLEVRSGAPAPGLVMEPLGAGR
jgi:hypothetical protein